MPETDPPETAGPASPEAGTDATGQRTDLPPAAVRALREAEERRKAVRRAERLEPEIGGRGGLDPVRYGDWEVKGLSSDF